MGHSVRFAGVGDNFAEGKRIPKIQFDCEESEDLEQTARILDTLIGSIGLPVPVSYIYKKFSIPEPESGEETAAPPAPGLLPFKREFPDGSAAQKAEPGAQVRIDRLAEAALRGGAGSFQKAFAPVLEAVERAESLEELRAMLEDRETVAQLYKSMDVSQVENLLQKVMLYADLEGRALEDGRD